MTLQHTLLLVIKITISVVIPIQCTKRTLSTFSQKKKKNVYDLVKSNWLFVTHSIQTGS